MTVRSADLLHPAILQWPTIAVCITASQSGCHAGQHALVDTEKERIKMIIIVNSKVNGATIQGALGKPEYSYHFLLKLFLPALERIARVISVESSAAVDPLYHELTRTGERVLFLSVSPPQQTPVDLACPTVCLFAWEFHDAPDQPWHDEPRNDWRYTLQRLAGAIACSQESAQAIRNLMGDSYPVIAIPAPVWAHFGDLQPPGGWEPGSGSRTFEFSGHVIDSDTLGLSANGLVQHLPRPPRQRAAVKPQLRNPSAFRQSLSLLGSWLNAVFRSRFQRSGRATEGVQPSPNPAGRQAVENCHIELSGVVFCSMFSPSDGRKNWDDIVTAFCWAFRDRCDATLILKMTHHDLEFYRIPLLTLLSRLSPFKCRVLTLHGFLADEKYRDLIRVSDFYVNASKGEGLCLPLMEFLSAGKPALAPRHTAMLDYLDEQVARIVHTSEELACWPHDPAGQLSTRWHRLNWESLMKGFRDCQELAQKDPEGYRRKSINAWQRMRDFSDIPVVAQQLRGFLAHAAEPPGAMK